MMFLCNNHLLLNQSNSYPIDVHLHIIIIIVLRMFCSSMINEFELSVSYRNSRQRPEGFTYIEMLFYNEFLRKQNINMCRDQTHHLSKTTTGEILYCRTVQRVCVCVCGMNPLATAQSKTNTIGIVCLSKVFISLLD